jgi:hypothetical protein
MTWHHSLGHKGPVLRPRCIGIERPRAQLVFYSSLFSKKPKYLGSRVPHEKLGVAQEVTVL